MSDHLKFELHRGVSPVRGHRRKKIVRFVNCEGDTVKGWSEHAGLAHEGHANSEHRQHSARVVRGLNRVSRVLRSRRQRKYAPGNCNGGATMHPKLAEQCGHVNFNCAFGHVERARDLFVG